MATIKELLDTKIDYDEIVESLEFAEEITALGVELGDDLVQVTDTDASGFDFVLDEDNMSTNSATKLATQQSIKKYVDDQNQLYSEKLTDGALATSGAVVLTKAGVGAYTLALPAAADDGKHLYIISGTANAHVVTLPSAALYDGSGTPKNTITFDAQIGASLHMIAVNETWCTIGDASVVTLSAE